KLGGAFAVEAEQHAADDRRGRARRAGPKRQRLKEADAERLTERKRVHGGGRAAAHGAFDGENRDPADKQRGGHRRRREEIALDYVVQEKSYKQRGQRRDADS